MTTADLSPRVKAHFPFKATDSWIFTNPVLPKNLVDDILMPLVGMVTGNVDFTNLAFQIGEGEGAAVLKYGNFIQNTVDFIIVAFCIFLMLKGINKLNRKKEEPAPAPEEPKGPTQEELLAEIRDLLKNK